jgi:hypothetical protein
MASTMDYQRFPMSTHVNMKYNDEEIDITGTYDRRQNSQNGKLKIKSPSAMLKDCLADILPSSLL